ARHRGCGRLDHLTGAPLTALLLPDAPHPASVHEPHARARPQQVTGGQDAREADPMRMDREAELVDKEDGATDADDGADHHDAPDIADGSCVRRTRLAGEHGRQRSAWG